MECEELKASHKSHILTNGSYSCYVNGSYSYYVMAHIVTMYEPHSDYMWLIYLLYGLYRVSYSHIYLLYGSNIVTMWLIHSNYMAHIVTMWLIYLLYGLYRVSYRVS